MLRILLIAAILLIRPSFSSAQSPEYVLSVRTAPFGILEANAEIVLDNSGDPLQGWSMGVCHDPSELTLVEVMDGLTTLALDPDFNQVSLYSVGWTAGTVISFLGSVTLPPGTGYSLYVGGYDSPLPVGTSSEVCFCDTLGTPDVLTVVVTGGVAFTPTQFCGDVEVGASGTLEAQVIIAGESSGGLVDSVDALATALENLGQTVLIVPAFPSSSVITPKAMWVLNGTFPNNRVLSQTAGAQLVALIEEGVPVYLESSDAWGFDPPTPFSDYDGIYYPPVGDGDDSFQGMIGSDYGPALLAGLDAPYTQDSLGNDSTDRLFASPFDQAGPNAGVIWSDDGAGGTLVPYDTGVFYDTDPGFGKVLCQSWEFGGHGGNQTQLALRYVDALGAAAAGAGDFRRGDSNGDGVFDISDAIFLLAELFSGGPASPCGDASDTNDDGVLDIGDGVFTLGALFYSMVPPPAPGAIICGSDSTPDVLDCVTYDCS